MAGDEEMARSVLEAAVRRGALLRGQFTLSSGQVSRYYFDGRLLSLSPEGANLLARALLPLVRESGADAVGGPTLGADPIVTAVAMLSHLDGGKALPAFIVRKESKEHGTGKAIEGPLSSRTRVAIIDDACSAGESLFHAIRAVEEVGCTVELVLAVLDRKQGGSDRLRAAGYSFHALLQADTEGNISPAVREPMREHGSSR